MTTLGRILGGSRFHSRLMMILCFRPTSRHLRQGRESEESAVTTEHSAMETCMPASVLASELSRMASDRDTSRQLRRGCCMERGGAARPRQRIPRRSLEMVTRRGGYRLWQDRRLGAAYERGKQTAC